MGYSISVVMSVYNGAEYVTDAVKSILNQSYGNFEFIIVNDGSTDDSLKIIQSFGDKRIKIINQGNQGLVASLNTAINTSKGSLIARQDADDISLPDRLAKQVEMFQANPNLVLLGSSIITIDENSKEINVHKVLLSDPELKQELFVRSPFAHGSIMLKKQVFFDAGGYKKDEWPAEDYGLWLRMAEFGAFSNIDEPLYKYRENSNGISAQNLLKQQEMAEKIRNTTWQNRKVITPKKIIVGQYKHVDMGEFRIERIVNNVSYSLIKSLKSLDIYYFFRYLLLFIKDKYLFKKAIRQVLIALKLKHA